VDDVGPVSRILSGVAAGTTIPLGCPLLNSSSDLPEGLALRAETQRTLPPVFLPIWSCSAWGLPCPVHHCPGGALLPHLFTLTPQSGVVCFLWHFPSSGLEPAVPDVIRHTALWSSDFPPSSPCSPGKPGVHRRTAAVRPTINSFLIIRASGQAARGRRSGSCNPHGRTWPGVPYLEDYLSCNYRIRI